MKFYGRGNDRDRVEWYRDLWSYVAEMQRHATSTDHVMLVGQNFLDDEFLDFDGPKVFNTWESSRYMTERTNEILRSGVIADHHFSYADPDPAERMCHPALGSDRFALADDLDSRVGERRPRAVCMVNRFVDASLGTLYGQRIAVATALAEDIDLYGRPARDSGEVWDHPRYLGLVEDKRATLSAYTFNVCFENTDEPGYLTEKLFDALSAGCVPLYRGGGGLAADLVPQACLVDCAGLAAEEVAGLIHSMSHEEVVEHRRAGVAFLRSEAAERFTYRDHRRRIARRLERQDH